jgi:cytochrome c oxidase subunit 2
MSLADGASKAAALRIPWRRAAGCVILLAGFPQMSLAAGTSVFSPASPPADAIRNLFVLVLIVAGAIFLLVEGLLVYNLARFRASKGDRGSEPTQVYGTGPLEFAWTIVPLLIVFVLFLVVVRTVVAVNEPQLPAYTTLVQVVGHRWWWEFRYPRQDFRTANEMHMPTGTAAHERPVQLDLYSADVVHSLWVPELAGKTDLVPGRTNHTWFATDLPGVYPGQCAEYCGVQHAHMRLLVIAEPLEAFRAWARHQAEPAVDEPAVAADRRRFMALACINCHRIVGTLAQGTFGPDLTHVMSRRTLAAVTLKNDPKDLRDWIRDPQAIKPGCLMPDMQLSERDVGQVARYLESLR